MNIRLICILLLANTLSLHLWSQDSQTKTIKTFLEKGIPRKQARSSNSDIEKQSDNLQRSLWSR